MADKMGTFEIIALIDIVSTVALEFWQEYRKNNPNPMTADEFAALSASMRERRKAAMSAIAAH